MRVRVFGTLRSVLGGSKEIEVHLEARPTARDLLDQLIAAYPAVGQKILGQGGGLRGGVSVLVNGRSVRFLDGLSTVLEADDDVALFPPVGGG